MQSNKKAGRQNKFKQVLKRDNFKCVICGQHSSLHIHHIMPFALGGKNTLENLVTLCANCHKAVHTGDIFLIVEGSVLRALMKEEDRWIPEKMLDPNHKDYWCGWCGADFNSKEACIEHLRKKHGDCKLKRLHVAQKEKST